MTEECSHLLEVETRKRGAVHPSGHGCQECLRTGGFWVHLRLCMTCGHVGCCDDSPNHHATAHFKKTGHPVIKSFEPKEDWAWCYVDQAMVEAIPAFAEESPSRHFTSPTP